MPAGAEGEGEGKVGGDGGAAPRAPRPAPRGGERRGLAGLGGVLLTCWGDWRGGYAPPLLGAAKSRMALRREWFGMTPRCLRGRLVLGLVPWCFSQRAMATRS